MNSFRCPQCSFLSFATAKSCKRCNAEFDSSQPFANEDYSAENQKSSNFNVAPQSQTHRRQRSNFAEPPQLKSGLALASMIVGIVGFTLCSGLFGLLAIPGLIMGIVALVKAKRNPYKYGGQGYAIAGLVTNGIHLVLIPLVAAIAIPNLLAARRAANEGAAISTMRKLMQAEFDYLENSQNQRCADLGELANANLIDRVLADGQKSGYKFAIGKKADGNCELFAMPLVSNGVAKSGTRSFYVSTDEWEIRAATKDGLPAGKTDPKLETFNSYSNAKTVNRDDD